MLTLWSQSLIPTSRQAPTDATAPSHQLMLRAGLIRQLGAGLYDYLPLGLRTLHKVMAIIREEMNRAGAVEVLMPTLHPIELWEQTGRRTAYGENLFVVKDRHGREQALGPTHEEVFTELVRGTIESYKQLPITLYQIQTKFRDEFRPRFGVIRSREFQMKDAYSFDITVEGLDASYQKMYDAYCRIYERCGLPYRIVEAESGPIGGSASHEFMVPSPTGEDTILESDRGNYAANVEKCATGKRDAHLDAEPKGDLEKIHTPGCPGIDDVVTFFKKNLGSKLKPANMLKTLVYAIKLRGHTYWVLAVVRGDHDVNEAKLRQAVGTLDASYSAFAEISLADEREVREAGFKIGFVGPHIAADWYQENSNAAPEVDVVVDPDAAQGGFWVTGANEVDHHVKAFNWKRDVLDHTGDANVTVADIRNAVAGDPSPLNDGGVLRETKGIEVGHVFKLGCKYSQAMDLRVLDENNQRREVIMGCYGIGVNRIMASAIESVAPGKEGHDADGIIWPAAIAPYHVVITPIKFADAMRDTAHGLAAQLEDAGLDVLIDDRDASPGVKFKDADLLGIPVRITVGDKALAAGNVEIKSRRVDKADHIKVEAAANHVVELLKSL